MVVDLHHDSDVEEVFAVRSDGNSVQLMQKRNPQNQQRCRKSIVVSLESSPDIEEVIMVGGFKQVDKENVAAITIDDDDIVVLSENLI